MLAYNERPTVVRNRYELSRTKVAAMCQIRLCVRSSTRIASSRLLSTVLELYTHISTRFGVVAKNKKRKTNTNTNNNESCPVSLMMYTGIHIHVYNMIYMYTCICIPLLCVYLLGVHESGMSLPELGVYHDCVTALLCGGIIK